jgi:hypothetical protein
MPDSFGKLLDARELTVKHADDAHASEQQHMEEQAVAALRLLRTPEIEYPLGTLALYERSGMSPEEFGEVVAALLGAALLRQDGDVIDLTDEGRRLREHPMGGTTKEG